MESASSTLEDSQKPYVHAMQLLTTALIDLEVTGYYLTAPMIEELFEIARKRNLSLQKAAEALAIGIKSREYVDEMMD